MKTYKKEKTPNWKKWALLAAVIWMTGTWSALGTAQAKEETLASHGNFIYENSGRNGERLEWYAEDLLLLKEKLSTIPEQCFDPACYTHEHCFVYRDITENTHTKHCEECGAAFDSISAHAAVREERCTISHGGKEYLGRKFICECGWQWMRETGHTLLYEPSDAVNHTVRCALDGSAYCQGYEPVTEEHYAYYYVPDEEGMRHEKVCLDCGYREEEACSFSLEKPPLQGDAEDGNAEDDQTGQDAVYRWCVCGNCRNTKRDDAEITLEEEPAPPAVGEPPEMPDTPEDPADEESEQPKQPESPADEETLPSETPEPPADEGTAPSKSPETPEPPADEEPAPPEVLNIPETVANRAPKPLKSTAVSDISTGGKQNMKIQYSNIREES